MGKTKQKRKLSRNCPTGLPSVKETEEVELEEEGETKYHYIIEKLQSVNIEDKECAACTIANLVSQPKVVTSLLEANIVKIAGPLLIDSSYAVRHTIAGALRNLSVCGHQICEEMIHQDVMTPLVALLQQYDCDWSPAKSSHTKIDSKTEAFVEAVNLLWNLCESSEIAVNVFEKQGLLGILLRCLDVKQYEARICIAVAQCLNTVSEDNSDVIRELSKSNVLELLDALLNHPGSECCHLLLRILATGLMLNIHFGQLTCCTPPIVASVLKTLTDVLNLEISPLLQSLSESVLIYKKGKKNRHKNNLDSEQKEAIIESTSSQLNDLFSALHIALEIITNMCNCDDGPESWENLSSSSNASSESTENLAMEQDDVIECHKFLNIPCELHEVIVGQKLFPRILSYVCAPDEAMTSSLQSHSRTRDVLKRIHTIRCRALLCINNLVQSLDLEDMGGLQEVYQIWMKLGSIAMNEIDVKDVQLLDADTCAMRAILQKLVEIKACHLFQQMEEKDIQLFIFIGQQSQDSGIRTNIIRIVATLSNLLNETCNEYFKIIKEIALYLLDVSSKDSELMVVAEALDALIDVFSEDHLLQVEQEILLVDKLKHLLSLFKGKINHQKKNLGKDYPVIMTTKTNLVRFIKYKSQIVQNGDHHA